MSLSTFLRGPVLVMISLAACSSGTREGFQVADPTAPPEEAAPAPSTSFGEQDAGGAKPADGCSEEAKLVYVLSLEGDIYSFAPADKKFTKIGALDCKLDQKTFIPISMAVDRDAIAWVNMREDSFFFSGQDVMFKVDTKTAACTPTNIRGGWGGMGFSVNAGTKDEETLFAISSGALHKVDFAAEKLVRLSDLPEEADLELTGTGDGRLYGFLIDDPLALARIDKATSAYSERVTLATIERPQSPMFAFSFWGGDFYFYTATSTLPSSTTNVTRYRPSDGSVDTSYMTQIGFHIVGAGVSTCAPLSGPR